SAACRYPAPGSPGARRLRGRVRAWRDLARAGAPRSTRLGALALVRCACRFPRRQRVGEHEVDLGLLQVDPRDLHRQPIGQAPGPAAALADERMVDRIEVKVVA